MANVIGAAMRSCVLAGCLLAAVSAETISQQSSAWGSVVDGVSVDRGASTSHTSDPRPGEPEPELGLRGGFGGRRPPPTAGAAPDVPLASQTPPPQVDPADFNDYFHNFMQQYPGAFANLPGGFQQPKLQPVPGHQGFPHPQPVPGHQGGFPQPQPVPGYHGGFPQLQPNFGLRGGFPQQQPVPSNQGDFPQAQPDLGVQGGFDGGRQQPQPFAGDGYDASRHPYPVSAPCGRPSVGDPRPVDPSAAPPVPGALGYQGGAGAGGASVASAPTLGLQPGWRPLQPSEIHSTIAQWNSQVFGNPADCGPAVLPDGSPVPGQDPSLLQFRSGGGASQPGAPGVLTPLSAHDLARQRSLLALRRLYLARLYALPRHAAQLQPLHTPQPHSTGHNAIYPPPAQTVRE